MGNFTSEKDVIEKLGVVEKVSFKNNPKIGKEGWRHIATFIYMSRSLKAIDLSMIPFPDSSAQMAQISPKSTRTSDGGPPPQMEMVTDWPAEIGISCNTVPSTPTTGSESGITSSFAATRHRWYAIGWKRNVS